MFRPFQVRFAHWAARRRWAALQVWLITLLALGQAAIFLAIVPPWQHYDEPAHFRFAWSRVNLEPKDRDPSFTPLDPTMVRETLGSMVEHEFYAALPTPNFLRTHGIDNLGHSQSGEFPLYYDLLFGALWSLRFADVATQLAGARAFTALFFLASVWACIGLMRCLTAPGHPLRWLVPVCFALAAPLADIFTAVNNDGAAIAGFTFFLWGAVHALTRRLAWGHVLWLGGAMAFTILAKQALLFVSPLAPLALLLAWFQTRGWAWRWLICGLAAAGIGATLLTVRLHSPAFWTTRWAKDTQGRVRHDRAVHGDHAMAALVNYETLYQRMPSAWVRAHPERRLNFGAWVWSDEPVAVPVLGFAYVAEDAHFMYTEVLSGEEAPMITSEPQFIAHPFWVPKEAEILYLFLWPYTLVQQDTANRVYYDGLALVEGVVDLEAVPAYVDGDTRFVRWGEREAPNLARNPSGEAAWPNVLPAIDLQLEEWASWNLTAVLHRVLDVRWSGRILWVQQPKFMLLNLFNRLAWGGVQLPGPLWGRVTLILAALGILGCGLRARALILAPRARRPGVGYGLAYGFLATCLALIWAGADLWIVKFMWMDNLHLSDTRYTFPAIAAAVAMIAGGIRYLAAGWPRLQARTPLLLAGLFLLFDAAAIWAYIRSFDYVL